MSISALESLLAQKKVDANEVVTKKIYLERFGKTVDLSFKRLSYAEYKMFRKQSMAVKRGEVSFDVDQYRTSIVRSCLTDPDFSKVEFLKAIGAPNGDVAIGMVFLPGEIVSIGEMILAESGFSEDPFRDNVSEGEGGSEN